MRRSSFLAVTTLAAFAIPSAFGAQIGEATTPDGGIFAGACAGTFFGSVPNPGVSAANFFGSTLAGQTNSSAPGGSTSASAASSGSFNGRPMPIVRPLRLRPVFSASARTRPGPPPPPSLLRSPKPFSTTASPSAAVPAVVTGSCLSSSRG